MVNPNFQLWNVSSLFNLHQKDIVGLFMNCNSFLIWWRFGWRVLCNHPHCYEVQQGEYVLSILFLCGYGKLYLAFFQSKTSPKMGLKSTKPHQKMFLEFSNLGLDCSLNISHASHDTLHFHLDWTFFKWKMVFTKEFEVTKY
jgi:hypothetical protein